MGVQAVHDGLADGAGLAVRRREMHAQPGRGIHLDKAAALLLERAQYGLGHHVHAADVQAHHLGCGHGACGDLGVHIVGHVGGRATGGQVGVVAQHHALALLGHGLGRQALQCEAGQRNVVQPDLGERSGMAFATARVLVDDVDQLAHRALAIPQHLWWLAPRRGHELVAHHQQAEVLAGQKALDHDGAVLCRVSIGFFRVGRSR